VKAVALAPATIFPESAYLYFSVGAGEYGDGVGAAVARTPQMHTRSAEQSAEAERFML
jgi:hypothetical protein